MLHGGTVIAGFPLELYKSLQPAARKNRLIQHKINEMAVVQAELGSGLIDHIQKMTIAAITMADMKAWAQRS